MTSEVDMETPGFGFKPTDQELVGDYLPCKISGLDKQPSPIADIDNIYNYEPWDLRKLAAIPSKDTWYFCSLPDRKYGKSGRNNRRTRAGYWKVTGKKREVKNGAKDRVIGFKRILVFFRGRVRDPVWTNWVIYEYYLNPSYSDEDYVISRLHLKPPKKTVNSVADEGENPVTEIPFPEIDLHFMEEFSNSNGQDFTSSAAPQPQMHMGTNGPPDDDSVLLPQIGIGDQLDNNTESVKSFPDIQDVQYDRGSVHPAPDDSSPSEPRGSLPTGNISDTEAVNGFVDRILETAAGDDNGWGWDWDWLFEHDSAYFS